MFRELVAAKRRIEDDYDRGITLAWCSLALRRTKTLPKLETLLIAQQRQDDQPQTLAQMRASLQMLSDYYKIPLRRKPVTRG